MYRSRPVPSAMCSVFHVVSCLLALARPAAAGDELANADLAPFVTATPFVNNEPVSVAGDRTGLFVGVRAGVVGSPGERERIFGVIELGVPFERFWVGP